MTMATSVRIGKKPDSGDADRRGRRQGRRAARPRRTGPDLALRVAVRPGGCSGFSYEMFFDTEVADDDVVRDVRRRRVVVDPTSAELLTGATLDYSDGLQGAGFHITNPNATQTCGCGCSFS